MILQRISIAMRIAALAAAVLPVSATASTYTFTTFDGPGNNGGGTTVNGINNNGDIVGFSSDNAASPTLFTNFIRDPGGAFTILSTGGDPLAMANGINDPRTVVGGLSSGTAFSLAGGILTTLPAVNSSTTTETAFGINDPGAIVGQFTDSNTGTTPGYLFSGGVFTILSPVPNAAVTNAQGVNASGLVAGFYSTDGVHQHGFFYNSATGTYTLPPDPVVPNLVLTQFLSVNDQGMAVGYYQLPDGSQHGFLYNTHTQSYTFLDDPSAAHSGLSITQITGINDSGDLAGFYVDPASGLQRGFVAAPVTPTPEPQSLALLLGLLFPVLLAFRAYSRRHA